MKTVIWHVLVVANLGLGSGLLWAAEQCPAVACDCASLPSSAWQQECKTLEAALITQCVANHQVPQGFCGIHGPEAKPLPLATQLNPVEVATSEPEVELWVKQLATAQWSLNEDLASLQKQLDAGSWSNVQPIAKLFDSHVDAAFLLQRRVTASLIKLNRLPDAQDEAEIFVKKARQLADASKKVGEAIWQLAIAAPASEVKTRQALAQRILRSTGKLYEHQGLALAAIQEQNDAAKAWQEAARLAEVQVRLESAGTQKLEYLTFYRQQASARWNRASLCWALAKNDNKALEAKRQAKDVTSQLTGVSEDEMPPHK